MVELLELRQDDFVTVPIDGENLHRTPDDNVGAVASFAFSEDERRGGELDDLGDLGKRAELAGLQIAEQSQALEKLLAFLRNHDSSLSLGENDCSSGNKRALANPPVDRLRQTFRETLAIHVVKKELFAPAPRLR
jgi:hypothetical protein